MNIYSRRRRKYQSPQTKRNRRVAFKNFVRLNSTFFVLGMGIATVFLVKLGCLPANFFGFTIAPF